MPDVGRTTVSSIALLLIVALGLIHCRPVGASSLAQTLAEYALADLFPGAERSDPVSGSPPVATVHGAAGKLGYLFLNTDFVDATGYSGKPIHVLVGIGVDGVIRSARLIEHHEPIVLIGIPERRVRGVIDNYVGIDAAALAEQGIRDRSIDALSGATVTVMVIDDSVLRSAIKVARRYGLGGLTAEVGNRGERRGQIDPNIDRVEDWIALIGDGSVRRLKLTLEAVNRAFAESGDERAAARPEQGDSGDTYIELYAGLVSVPTIGRSLLGEREYANLVASLAPGQHALLVAARGRYSFKGSGYVRGGIFDRFQLVQGDRSIRFRDRDHKRLRRLQADGSPELAEVDLFLIPTESSFNPAETWYLELLVSRATGPTQKAFVTFGLDYQTPDRYLRYEEPAAVVSPGQTAADSAQPGAAAPPLWQRLWREKRWQVAALLFALSILTLIFFFQTWLVRHTRLTETVRVVFLVFTLFGIGYYANAQLSVVNILTVFNALVSGFDWGFFLMEPLVFILWGSVAGALLFWGRGAYCGWLCPFGALQELINRIAKLCRVPQFALPWGLHERLWALKYIIFLILFGVSLHSLAWAERLAEVEPFKTAIILNFVREWPYVVFALAMLLPGLFIERFYCRYFCALGAALAIPARLRMFEWLKRYRQCGSPCQICAKECMVQAIHPEGHINPNECLYCLHCQELYHDDQRCPVMIQRRKRDERAHALASKDGAEQTAALLQQIRASRDARSPPV